MRTLWTIALAALVIGCGATRAAPRSPAARRACADVPPPRRPTPRAYPGPSVGELAGLEREHRAASGRVPVEDGVVSVPIDWRTLPTTAVLWSDPEGSQPLFVGGALVTMRSDREALIARDPRSGRELWRVPTPHASGERPYALSACDRVVLFDSRRVAGLDPASGEVLWEIAIEPTRTSYQARSGAARIEGCHLAFLVTEDAMRLADGFDTTRVRMVDLRTGAIIARPTCPARCSTVSAEREGLVVAMAGAERWFFPWDGGDGARLPEGTGLLAGGLAIAFGEAIVARDRTSGELRWRRELAPSEEFIDIRGTPLARLGGDVVVLDGTSIARISAATGEDVWRTRVSAEIAGAIAHGRGAQDGSRWVLGTTGAPRILLDLDLASGAVRSLRVATIQPAEVAVDGDLVAIRSNGRVGVVDVSLDAPAMRERLLLDDDVERAIAELTRRGGDSHAPAAYPRGRFEAMEWLRRLRPITGDVLSSLPSRLERTELGTASAWLEVLAGTDAATPAAVRVLERTYGCAPTERLAQVRIAASAALDREIEPAQADELAVESVAWLDELLARSAPSDEDGVMWEAVIAGRDALFRASRSREPLGEFAAAVARHSPPATPSRCAPSDDDAARAAVLRHRYELATGPHATILVPGAECIEVHTLGGPLELVTEGRSEPPWVHVGEARLPSELDELGSVSLPWPGAPSRVVEVTYYADPLAAQAELFLVQRVDGAWRVVDVRLLWVA